MSELKESAVSLDGLRNLIEEEHTHESEESVDERMGESGDLHNCVRISSYKSRTRSARSGGLMGSSRNSMLREFAQDRPESILSSVVDPRQSRQRWMPEELLRYSRDTMEQELRACCTGGDTS